MVDKQSRHVPMRASSRTKNGKTHTYWRLVESVRVNGKVAQRTIAHLGAVHAEGRGERWPSPVDCSAITLPDTIPVKTSSQFDAQKGEARRRSRRERAFVRWSLVGASALACAQARRSSSGHRSPWTRARSLGRRLDDPGLCPSVRALERVAHRGDLVSAHGLARHPRRRRSSRASQSRPYAGLDQMLPLLGTRSRCTCAPASGNSSRSTTNFCSMT